MLQVFTVPPGDVVAVGNVFTVVVANAGPVHPLKSVTITENEPAVVTVMDGVLAPVDQKTDCQNGPTSSTVEPPAQNDSAPNIIGAGVGVALVVTDVLPVQPLPLVTVTV